MSGANKPNLAAFLAPRSVAIIGAAPAGQGLRGRILEIMLMHAYPGQIYPVSRSHVEVQGLKAYPTIAEAPPPVDLAVLLIPAKFVAQELEACGKAGVRAAAILSSGFAEEAGSAGREMQAQIADIARRYGMAVNGPNSEGFANLALNLAPTFSPAMTKSDTPLIPASPLPGRVAVVGQSGGMCFAFFDHGRPKELSFSHIVTTGNEAAMEVFDVVEYLVDDGDVDAICILLEDIKTADTFRRASEKALRAGVPLIVVKIGRSDAGARAAASHTAAMSGSYSAFQAVARRYGIIEGANIEEMVDIAQGFMAWKGRLPRGKRVGICTASGGGGGWAADACASAGLSVPMLDAATRKSIDAVLPAYGTSQNPIDGTAQTIHDIGHSGLAKLVLPSPEIDAILSVMSGRAINYLKEEQAGLVALKRDAEKPVLLWSYTLPVPESAQFLASAGLPVFTNLEHAVSTLRHMADWRALRERFPIRSDARVVSAWTRDMVTRDLAAAPPVLTEAQSKPLLAAYGVGTVEREFLATTRSAAIAAAARFGGAVALKVQSPDITHKTEAGAVALGVDGAQDVGETYDRILGSAKRYAPDATIEGVLVQAMAPKGREVIVGVSTDPTFGPLLMLGLGGIHVEVLKDVAFAPVPLTHDDARDLISSLKGAALLGPIRGAPAADTEALCDLIVRVSEFATDHTAQIAEIDLNPVIVHDAGQGITVADALIIKRA